MTGNLTIRIEKSIAAISPQSWSRLSGASKEADPLGSSSVPYNPFLSHAFLSALEESGSATAKTGWHGQHLLLEDDKGQLIGAVPGYLKSHSQGEYVFDHGWADAFERAGGRYYPKLQCAVPFTPATGPRLLVASGFDREMVQTTLAEGLQEVTRQLGISSAHVTFVPDDEVIAFEEAE